jgi:hypothetical protein
MEFFNFKKTIRDCMIDGCNNKVPEQYPLNASFCEKHTCTYVEFDKSKNICRCYLNRTSNLVETCTLHTCKYNGCLNSTVRYNSMYKPDIYCDSHNLKTATLQKLSIVGIAVVIYAYYMYFCT